MTAALFALALAETPLVLAVPEAPGPWMRGEQELCVTAKGRGRSLGPVERELPDGMQYRCRRIEGKLDEVCLIVEDTLSWPEVWPEGLVCTQGSISWRVSVVPAFSPTRAYGQTLWIKRPPGDSIAYTWTLPEGPIHEEGRPIRKGGEPWVGVTCTATGAWLSVMVGPEAVIDEGRCQFRSGGVSIPMRIDTIHL